MDSPEFDPQKVAPRSEISQPDNRCGLCGRVDLCSEHHLTMHMARKSLTMPGPAGLTYGAEVRQIFVTYKVCQYCEKRHVEQVREAEKHEAALSRNPRVWICNGVSIFVIIAPVIACVCLGGGWSSLFMLILSGLVGGITRLLLGWLLGIEHKAATPLFEGHSFIKALQDAGWSVGDGPSRFAIKSLPEHWLDEQSKIDARRKAQRAAFKESLKPKTMVDKIGMLMCISILLAVLGAIVYLIVKS